MTFSTKLKREISRQLKIYEAKQKVRKGSSYKIGRQSLATKGGQLIEEVAKKMLLDHPNVLMIQEQVFNEEIDFMSNIDLVITTKKREKIYVSVARDLWLGTAQQDRLQMQIYKHKLGVFERFNHVYLCSDDWTSFVNQGCSDKARRKRTIQNWLVRFEREGVLHNLDTLWEHINKS
jgi:hypothetical protein